MAMNSTHKLGATRPPRKVPLALALALALLTLPLTLTFTLSACASMRGRAVEAPLESASEAAVRREAEAAGCSLQLWPTKVTRSDTECFIDEHLSDGPGLLLYPCNLNGAAEASFGPHHYRGAMKNGGIELELTTELDWNDGCRWGTRGVLRGAITRTVDHGSTKLSWSYDDRVLRGSRCSAVCTAKASVDVRTLGSAESPKTPTRDDDDDEDDDDERP